MIEDEQQRGLLLDAITDLEFLAEKTVTNIEQTTAKALREAVKDEAQEQVRARTTC